MTTNADHKLGWKSMTEVQFALVQSQITIFASLICYKCMRVKIEELLGIVMITTYNERFLGFFYEQDEFCLPFRYGDDFRLPQRRNIQQRQQRRLDYSSGKEDDFRFNYWANNQGQNNQEFNMKMDLPSFNDQLHIEDFLD